MIQNTEKELDLRDSYSVSEGALVAGASILPVAALTAAVPAMKAGYRSLRPSATDIVGSVAEGKRVYLEGSDAGKAYMNNEIVEGSFVQIPSKAKKVLREDKFIDELPLALNGEKIEARDYQIRAFKHALQNEKSLLK